MNNNPSPQPVPPQAGGTNPSPMARSIQILGLLFGVPGALLGAPYTLWLAFDFCKQSGEARGFAALGALQAMTLDLLIGFPVLLIGLLVTKGSQKLRRLCLLTSIVILSLTLLSFVLPDTVCRAQSERETAEFQARSRADFAKAATAPEAPRVAQAMSGCLPAEGRAHPLCSHQQRARFVRLSLPAANSPPFLVPSPRSRPELPPAHPAPQPSLFEPGPSIFHSIYCLTKVTDL